MFNIMSFAPCLYYSVLIHIQHNVYRDLFSKCSSVICVCSEQLETQNKDNLVWSKCAIIVGNLAQICKIAKCIHPEMKFQSQSQHNCMAKRHFNSYEKLFKPRSLDWQLLYSYIFKMYYRQRQNFQNNYSDSGSAALLKPFPDPILSRS